MFSPQTIVFTVAHLWPYATIDYFIIKHFLGYIGQAISGLTISWTGPMLLKFQDPSQSPLSIELSDSQLSLIASLVYLGAIPGKKLYFFKLFLS